MSRKSKPVFWIVGVSLLAVVMYFLNWQNSQTATSRQRNEAIRNFAAMQTREEKISYKYFSQGLTNENLVCLTFDDGPSEVETDKILEILKRENVKAVFFLVGNRVTEFPNQVCKIVAEGHEIGNHSQTHQTHPARTVQDWECEIGTANAAVARILERSPRYFRAPGCRYTSEALIAIEKLGMIRIDTSNNSADYNKTDRAEVLNRVLGGLRPGCIILLHDRGPVTIDCLPELIQSVRKRGYEFIPLIEMIEKAQASSGFVPAYCPSGQGIQIPPIKKKGNLLSK